MLRIMESSNREDLWKEVKSILLHLDPNQKRLAIKELRSIIDRELVSMEVPSSEIVCHTCQCTELCRYGNIGAGTARFRCKRCGKVQTFRSTGAILANTKLPMETWKAFAECFVNAESCPTVADKLGVTLETAWFIRVRMMEAV